MRIAYAQVSNPHRTTLFVLIVLEGMHLADVSVFISCALSLAAFDVTKYVENGVVIEPVHDCTTGTIR